MSDIKVRNLEDWIVTVHRDKAVLEGQSLEQYMRDLLKELALESQRQFAKEQRKHLAEFEQTFGTLTESAEGIRQDRAANL